MRLNLQRQHIRAVRLWHDALANAQIDDRVERPQVLGALHDPHVTVRVVALRVREYLRLQYLSRKHTSSTLISTLSSEIRPMRIAASRGSTFFRRLDDGAPYARLYFPPASSRRIRGSRTRRTPRRARSRRRTRCP